MRFRALLFILPAFLTNGCLYYHSRDISQFEPFSAYVGRTVELNRPMILLRGGNWFLPGALGVNVHTVDYSMVNTADVQKFYQNEKIFAELPVGQKVTILRVTDDADFDEEAIVAYGRTIIPPLTNAVTFGYSWGMGLRLERAPWEPDTVPSRRDTADTNNYSHWIPPK